MSTTPKPAKTMSSRLLTMRFMQRSAASSPTTSSSQDRKTLLTPSKTSPKTLRDSQEQRPSKRQRLSNGKSSSVSSMPLSNSNQASELSHSQAYDEALRAALAAEEALRVQADERRAIIRGESRWTLSFRDPQYPSSDDTGGGEVKNSNSLVAPLRVVTAGYGDIDTLSATPRAELASDERNTENAQGDDESVSVQEKVPSLGRRTFGKFRRRASEGAGNHIAAQREEEEEERTEDSGEESSDDQDPNDSESTSSESSETSDSASNSPTRPRHPNATTQNPTPRSKTGAAPFKASTNEHFPISQSPRGQKKVSTRTLTSISAAGAGRPSTTNDSQIICHKCRMKGHKIKDCPKMVRERGGEGQQGTGSGARGGRGYGKAPMGLT